MRNDILKRRYITADEVVVDWNNNDPSKSGYIENKPFYLEKDVVILPETTISREPMVWYWDYILLENGKTYNVTWDGVLYECEIRVDNSGLRIIGNASLYNSWYINADQKIDTGEPFCIYTSTYMGMYFSSGVIAKEKTKTHTIAIEGILEEITMSFSSKSGYNNSYLPFINGNTYDISWDGVKYSLTCINANDNLYIGNGSILDASLPNTGEPFAFTNQSIYTTEGEHTFAINGLIPERTYNFFPMSRNAEGMYIWFNTNINFILLNPYKIIFDGVEYDTICYSDGSGFYFGNYHMDYYLTPGINPNTPPFFFYSDPEYGYIITYPGSHTFEIREDRYHTLDRKYLPELIGKFGEDEGAEIFNDYLYNKATGMYSHAEGSWTTASGSTSHAEGSDSIASGFCSHAEGNYTQAIADQSHAEGRWTIASGKDSHVQGKFNISDTEDKYAHIVGNGQYSNVRSNAHTIDWDGNAWYAGDIYVGSTSGTNKDEGSKKLATKEDIDNMEFITLDDIDAICGIVAAQMISFTVDGISYQAEEGMTWAEWIESDYNVNGFKENYDGSCVLDGNDYYVWHSTDGPVTPSHTIVSDYVYETGGTEEQ